MRFIDLHTGKSAAVKSYTNLALFGLLGFLQLVYAQQHPLSSILDQKH
jgi:hypothetical protein